MPVASTRTGETILVRSFPWVAVPLLVLLLLCVASISMTWQQQAVFGALMVATALVVSRIQSGRAGTLVMVIFSMCATTRYATWRIGSLERYFTSPWQTVDAWNALFMILLIVAEMYSFLILYLGYMQTIAPLRRPPVSLPANIDEWPTVDVMIPTYNEPMNVVCYTVLAAKQIDWPADKLNIFLLDDGGRAEFRDFAKEAGVEYIARPEHSHAKAGNINYALERSTADLVAIFDCDHVPTRSFLQVTAGWFLRDSKLGMLQTPHHFYSPDPFERNLGNFREVPNEGELFYGIIQDTNDLWNATFFCGSCAVLRRDAIDQVGGIAHETVTEDAHTSLRMQKLGWNTAYINLTQAGGLATETLADHVKQRVRWARGMAQILRIDNPLFGGRLKLHQRLCYFNAMLHFLYALPRLIFLTAPILYLVFGRLNIPGYWLTILVFAIPHLLLSTVTNSRIQGKKRYSFWNEIYETVLSPYILLPTLFALVSPKFGKFNVTAKGQNQEEGSFDSKLARPFIALLALNGLGLVMAVPRYLYWDHAHPGTIAMNCFWTLFNMVVLGVTLSICWEPRQRREAVRVAATIPIAISSHGLMRDGLLEDLSVGGASAKLDGPWKPGDPVKVYFPTEDPGSMFSARIVSSAQGRVRLAFEITSVEHQEAITGILFSGADRWLTWNDARGSDSILSSLLAVIAASATGFHKALQHVGRKSEPISRSRTPALASLTLLLLILGGLFFFLRSASGEAVQQPARESAAAVSVNLPLSALGARSGVLLDQSNRNQGVAFALSSDVFVEQGSLYLRYTLPESKESTSTLEVLLNDTLLAAVTPTAAEMGAGHGEVSVPIPPEFLVRQNRLTLRIADTTSAGCAVVQGATAPIQVEANSYFSFLEQRLLLASDLSLLPEPFVARTATLGSQLPVVFAHQPLRRTLEAAGVLVSWFGSQTQEGQTSYPVQLGSLPKGNAVVLLVAGDTLPGLRTPPSEQASISTIPNPVDPYGKLLVLAASNPEQLLALTQALALGQLHLSGEIATLGSLVLPPERSPDDAPRWINTRRVSLETLNGGNPLRTTGSDPLIMYLRLSPDYSYGSDQDMYVHLAYRNDAGALDPRSNLVVRLNGSAADSVPLHAGGTQQANLAMGALPAAVFGNTLQVQFYFMRTAGQECSSARFTGTIAGDSFIDLGKVNHLASLPNLHLFSNAGFPFTRIADLGETVVLLPDNATPTELTLYLNLLGYFGLQTGSAALRVEVADPAEASRHGNKDLLMLGSYDDLAGAPALAHALPMQPAAGGWRLSLRAAVVETFRGWLRTLRTLKQSPAESLSPEGVVEQVQSPFSGDRSLVLLVGKDDSTLQSMTEGLMAEMPHDGIRGSVSLWQAGNFVSYDYSTSHYYLRDVNPLTRMRLILPDHPWIFVFGLTGLVILFALWLNLWISQLIRRRLMGVPYDLDGNPNAPVF